MMSIMQDYVIISHNKPNTIRKNKLFYLPFLLKLHYVSLSFILINKNMSNKLKLTHSLWWAEQKVPVILNHCILILF